MASSNDVRKAFKNIFSSWETIHTNEKSSEEIYDIETDDMIVSSPFDEISKAVQSKDEQDKIPTYSEIKQKIQSNWEQW